MTKSINRQGSLLGGMLLVAGSAIGAGMLGIPMATGIAGFIPALIIFLFCWLFMTSTALLLLEVNLAEGKDSNIISMAQNTLGNLGKRVAFVFYVFLIYAMILAYIDVSGTLTQEFFLTALKVHIAQWQGSLFFTLLFGVFIYLGTFFVDNLNRLFMLGLVVSYVLLIVFGSSQVNMALLTHKYWSYSLFGIPVVIASFGYHNVIPSITSYLKGSRKKMIAVIFIGGGMPLVIYVLWEWLMLGVVPYDMFQNNPSLEHVLTYIKNPWVSVFAQYFAFFAIITSFLAQALALLDFLRDAFKVKKSHFNRFWLALLVLTPPYILAVIYPGIFIKALGYVGGFAAIILFVIMPAFMVWVLRYRRNNFENKILFGGKAMLGFIVFLGLTIMTLLFLQEFTSMEFIKRYL